jgi:hypothetical protein
VAEGLLTSTMYQRSLTVIQIASNFEDSSPANSFFGLEVKLLEELQSYSQDFLCLL